jgi:hypothetical protein
MATQVTHYQLRWNPGANQGVILASDATGEPHALPINSAAEFIAMALVLSKPEVVFEHGEFRTGRIDVGV